MDEINERGLQRTDREIDAFLTENINLIPVKEIMFYITSNVYI